jgi:uncharacterized membrane protein YjfL (UPF0719 family)
MEVTTFSQNLGHLAFNLGYAIVAMVVSVITLYLIDHFLFRKIDFIEEIKQGNIAASIFFSVVLLFVALIVTTSLN